MSFLEEAKEAKDHLLTVIALVERMPPIYLLAANHLEAAIAHSQAALGFIDDEVKNELAKLRAEKRKGLSGSF